MKKVLLLALLCLSFVASKAAPPMIFNNTSCDIVVSATCYDPLQCVPTIFCPPGIIIPAGGSIPFPTCPQCQVPPFALAYTVCWAQPQCQGICVTVAPPGSPCFPQQGILQKCICPQAAVYFDPMGNLIVQ
ncbi:MAG: hypothetical protein JWQ38_3625 [Flavipsychrobacter sp.]|nr:hypothetical protein [Flavipsychrobacter sp.]